MLQEKPLLDTLGVLAEAESELKEALATDRRLLSDEALEIGYSQARQTLTE